MRVHAISDIITTISILLVVFSGRWIADTPAVAVVLLVFALLYVAFLATHSPTRPIQAKAISATSCFISPFRRFRPSQAAPPSI